VVIADPSVSRRHAELEWLDDQALRLIDCQSTQGTHILERGRPRRVAREMVTPDTAIQLGDVTLSVSDLVDAIRLKYPALPVAAPPAPAASREPPRSSGSRLVRCGCGVIKPRGTVCPGCGL
jgi:hypothetical protein